MLNFYNDEKIKNLFLQPSKTTSNSKIKYIIDKCLNTLYSYSSSEYSWSSIKDYHESEIIKIKNKRTIKSKFVYEFCLLYSSLISEEVREDFLYYIEEFCPKIEEENISRIFVFNELRRELC